MIGIIGAGNMGRAIALRMSEKIITSDTNPAKLRFKKHKNILVARDNIDLTKRSRVIILAVKPQCIVGVMKEIAPFLKDKLIISIAAGVETKLIEKILGNARVIRAMPNMPAVAGKGISAITHSKFSRPKDLRIARKIFLKLGEVVELKENLMDAITAVCASGPAYYFLFTEALEKAARACGLNKSLARRLAKATFIGAAESCSTINISMEDFVKRVASKGGTTEAALKVFKEKGLEGIVEQAVRAAHNRSRDLTKNVQRM